MPSSTGFDCPVKFDQCHPCAGEDPAANLSAEGPEPNVFVGTRIIFGVPPIGRVFTQQGCKRWCYSTVSQEDADACAASQAMECATILVVQPPIVDPPNPPNPHLPSVTVLTLVPSTSFDNDPGIFSISRTGDTAQPLVVQFTLSGTAMNGVDYDTLPYSVQIAAGDSDVHVLVFANNTGETSSKTVILDILSTANYVSGTPEAATVTIGGVICGSPSNYRVAGYGPGLGAQIAALMPNASVCNLPEWDGGLLALPWEPGIVRSNLNCFCIGGRRVELTISVNQELPDRVTCPSQWLPFDPSPGCSFCWIGSPQRITFQGDLLMVTGDGGDPAVFFVNKPGGVLGDYLLYTSPECDRHGTSEQIYRISPDNIAHWTYGYKLLTVVPV